MLEVRSWYIVTTDENVYNFFILDCAENTINPDEKGLYTLWVYKAEDEDKQPQNWKDMVIPGVYKPEE